MPIYTYRCKKCGEEFDLLVGVSSDKEEYKCKKCNSKNIERTLSRFSLGRSDNVSNSSGLSCPTGTCSLE
jgi:putative FmdB family regulatory protein